MFCIYSIILIPMTYVANKIIDHLYPGKIKTYAAYYGWYILEYASRIEIKARNAYMQIKQYLPASGNEEEKSRIIIVKDGEEIATHDFNDFITLRESTDLTNTYDFIMYAMPIVNNDKFDTYIMRYNNHADIMKVTYKKVNDFNFNVIQFKFKDDTKTYNIVFNKNQFIIHNNILFDRDFLKWYMRKYYDKTIQDEDKYTITFFDHAMNYIEITDLHYIMINNKSYCIVNKQDNLCIDAIDALNE